MSEVKFMYAYHNPHYNSKNKLKSWWGQGGRSQTQMRFLKTVTLKKDVEMIGTPVCHSGLVSLSVSVCKRGQAAASNQVPFTLLVT